MHAARDETMQARTYRVRSQARVGVLVAIALVLFVLVRGGIAAAETGKAWIVPVALLIVAPGIWLGLRTARARIRIEDGGVRITNVLRTVVVPWEAVDRFSIGPRGLLPRVGIAELRNGRRITIWGIQGPNPLTRPKPGEAEEIIEELNRALARRPA
ncbi:MAG: PH domain-containing protein [Thermoleophilaceae bacterium]